MLLPALYFSDIRRKGDPAATNNADLNTLFQPPSILQPPSQQNPIQLQPEGTDVAGFSFSPQTPSNSDPTSNTYPNCPQMNALGFAQLNTSERVLSPRPTFISTSVLPTPALPAISSTPAHSTPTIIASIASSPLQTSKSLPSTFPGMTHGSPSSLLQTATGVNSVSPIAMLPGSGYGPTMIYRGVSHTPYRHPAGNPHPAMGGLGCTPSQRGVPHPRVTSIQYGMRENPVRMKMGMFRSGMVSAEHGMRYRGLHSPRPVAPGTCQMRLAGTPPQTSNPQLGHDMAPHMSGGMVSNPMMSGGMGPGQHASRGLPMASRQLPGFRDPQMLQGGLTQMQRRRQIECSVQQHRMDSKHQLNTSVSGSYSQYTPSPVTHASLPGGCGILIPPAFNKPEQSIPAPNITVSQLSGLSFSREMPITRVPQLQPSVSSNQVQQVLNSMRSSNPTDRDKAVQFLKANPEVVNRVTQIVQQQKERRNIDNISQDIVTHQPLRMAQQIDSAGFSSQSPSSTARLSPLPSGATTSRSLHHQQQPLQQTSSSPLTGVVSPFLPSL